MKVNEEKNPSGVTVESPRPAHEAGTILERCPFHPHESNLTEVVGEWFSNRRIAFWAVLCEACSAHGPEGETKEEAIAAWNTRINRLNVPERDSDTQ